MGLFDLFSRTKPGPEDAKARPIDEVIAALDAGNGSVHVNRTKALQVMAVLACVRVIAEGCSTPPLKIYEQLSDGKKRLAVDDPNFRLLTRRPNAWQTSLEFRKTLTAHAALAGSGYAFKVIVGGTLRELIPIQPQHCRVEELQRYDRRYVVSDDHGYIGTFSDASIFRLPGLSWDGHTGLPIINQARRAIGLATNIEDQQTNLAENGGRPGGIVSTAEKVGPEVIDRLKDQWHRVNSGKNAFKTMVLDGGWKYSSMAMSGVDAQHLETRRFQIEEICRAFGVFPVMIMHTDKASTYASAEAFLNAHRLHTLMPWHQLWCQRLDEFVLDGSGPLTCEFDTRFMTAAGLKERAEAARTWAEMGVMTRNELREMEGLDPLPGLDEPLTPLNMQRGTDDLDPDPGPEED